MSSDSRANFRVYRKHLSRKTQPFPCTFCGILVSPKDYENHCSRFHNLNAKFFCVWCCGNESWGSGEKNKHSVHLIDCFKQFYNSRQALTQPKALNLSPICPEVQSFFDHSTSIREWLPPRAFQSIWPPDLVHTPPMTFQNENLNLAASHLQLYLETRDTHDWMHVMVKAVAMENFLQILDSDDGGTRVLEFWCWCDGGVDTEHPLRQHRHMIAVSEPPKGRFKREIWPRVRAEPSPRPNFPSKRIKKIVSPLHLVNTLGYLSKRQSRCNFTRNPSAPSNNHFYISKTLPTDYKLPLSTLWPGGLLQLLYQEKFQRAIPSRIVENPLFRAPGGTKWQQKIKDFYDLERGLVIPVERRFAPTTQVTPHFLYLTRDRKLYFKPDPGNETLNEAAWLQMQSERGNAFYDAVGEETWTPRPRDQARINDMMPLVEKIQTLESEKREEKEAFEKKYETLKRRWEEERETCRKLSFKLNNVYEKEIDRLKKLIKNCSKCHAQL